jgi:hypothetical protein
MKVQDQLSFELVNSSEGDISKVDKLLKKL